MSRPNSSIDRLCETIENLDSVEFNQLNKALDQKRRSRLKEIVQKARQNAARTSPGETERILQKAIAEVRAENAAHRRT